MDLNKAIVVLIRRYNSLKAERRRLTNTIRAMMESEWACKMEEQGYCRYPDDIEGTWCSSAFIVGIRSGGPEYTDKVFVSKHIKDKRLKDAKRLLEYYKECSFQAQNVKDQEAKIKAIERTNVSPLGKNWIKFVNLVLRKKIVEKRLFKTNITIRTLNKLKLGTKVCFGDGRKKSWGHIYSVETESSEPIPVQRWLADQEFEAILE